MNDNQSVTEPSPIGNGTLKSAVLSAFTSIDPASGEPVNIVDAIVAVAAALNRVADAAAILAQPADSSLSQERIEQILGPSKT